MSRVLAFLLGLLGFAAAAVGLTRTVELAQVRSTASAIENGASLGRAAASAWSSRPDLAEAERVCGPPLRAAVSIRLAIVDAVGAAAGSEAWQAAQRAVDLGLRCEPLDGNLWLRRAMLAQSEPARLASLHMSVRTAPADGWVAYPRVKFTRTFLTGEADRYAQLFKTEMTAILAAEPFDRVMNFYVLSPPVTRGLVRAAALDLPTDRRSEITRLLDSTDHILGAGQP